MRKVGLAAAAVLMLSACASQTVSQAPTSAALSTAAPLPTATIVLPTATTAPTELPAASPTAVQPPVAEMCSPLAEIGLTELAEILTTPFLAPRPGVDDGHHGADFAYYRRGERVTMRGLPVLALFAGRVAGVTLDRRPYGNMLIVETPLESLPPGLAAALPEPAPTPLPDMLRLTCPAESHAPLGDASRLSLYVLYAHLNQAPLPAAGDQVSCGEQIGEVGTSGASVNEHLHLEMRIGPAGADLPGMAHYDPSATVSEQAAYCAWRVTGQFQLVDPVEVISEEVIGDR